MLTIRKPIELRAQKPIQGLRHDMAERMQANYGLMNMSIRKEEMLHVTSEPPEVYFAEGDNLQIFNNIKNENQQELRLDVINNLINRIIVSQTENFTYQDTVYISSVLRRLGIRDEKLFMKQVFALQNEHKETRQLLQNYENNQEVLKKFFLEQEDAKKTSSENTETVVERERRYYMHDEIFQRLETGKVYQDMRQFSRGNRHQSQQIFRTEMQLGEQATVEQNFLLQELKQNITNHPTPLYYCHNNQYEYLQAVSENITESLEEQMSAAILLNIVDQSYALRQDQIEENSHYWYSVAGALFQTAENTWKRYEANLLERKFVSNEMLQVLDQVNQIKHLENTTIQNIRAEYAKMEEVWNTVANTQNQLVQNQTQMNRVDEVNISGGSYHLTQEELELQYLNETKNIETEETSITVEQLQKQLEVFNQQNYENYLKLENIAKAQPKVKERKLNRKKAQRDALRALEHPDEVFKEYLTIEVHDSLTESQKEFQTQIYDMFSDETREIYRQFLLQNHATEETFLQHIMDQSEGHVVHEEVLESLKSEEYQKDFIHVETKGNDDIQLIQPVTIEMSNEQLRQQIEILNNIQSSKVYEIWTKPEELLLQIEQEEKILVARMFEQQEHIKQKSTNILANKNIIISEETTKLLEQLVLMHPEEGLEKSELEQVTDYKVVLQQLAEQIEDTILQKDIVMTLEYVEKQEYFKQIRSQIQEHIKHANSVLVQKESKKLQEQMQVLQALKTSNIYEQWTAPEEVIHQIEKEESVLAQRIHEQHEILCQHSESILKDSSVVMSEETTRILENMRLLHPEEILEEEELEQLTEYKAALQHLLTQIEEITLKKEVIKVLEYVEKQEFFKQIRSQIQEHIKHTKSVILETENNELQEQIQVLKDLQLSNIYEKWIAPKEVIRQIEKEERVLVQQMNEQHEILRQQSESILKDSSIVVSEETTRVLENVLLLHPEEVLEEQKLEQVSEYKTALQQLLVKTEEATLKKEIVKALEYVEKQEFFAQIRMQMHMLHELQSSNIYERWTMPKEVIRQVEEEEKVLSEQIYKQQETIRHQSERILKDSNRTISEETTKVLEKLTLVHPENISEMDGSIQEEEYKTILQHVMHETEAIELQNEIAKLLEYTEKKKLFKQIQQIVTTNTEYLQPVVFETMNQKIKHQMKVFENLQTTNLYEKWTMPADMIWQIEQEEAERVEESILRQKNVEKQLKRQQTEQRMILNQMKTEEIFHNIDFVHKVEEQVLNEELLEEIRMQRQTMQREEHTEQITLENKTMRHQTVQETVNHMQTTQLNQIEELVQQSVKRQIGDLSDQVYGKIEKKLQTERKRRGYF